MPSAVVSELNIYPVKSCRGISVRQATVVERGFRHDRRWMIADQDGTFLTQREHPRLSLIRTSLGADTCTLSTNGFEPLEIPLELTGGTAVGAMIWGDSVRALSAEPAANEWISTFLGIPARFLFMPDESIRPVDPEYAFNSEHVSFADGFPFLLLSEASVEDLNTRLSSPVPMNRFRPNIVVKDCRPYAEDSWEMISIGAVRFRVAKPCGRCAITTVDQDRGIKSEEPLRTLATYRSHAGNVNFGQNLVQLNRGIIHIDDAVNLLS